MRYPKSYLAVMKPWHCNFFYLVFSQNHSFFYNRSVPQFSQSISCFWLQWLRQFDDNGAGFCMKSISCRQISEQVPTSFESLREFSERRAPDSTPVLSFEHSARDNEGKTQAAYILCMCRITFPYPTQIGPPTP